MLKTGESAPKRRRYGRELEEAILRAAWIELTETGYGSLTMDSVARRAGTSEPVLYRRWPNKDELTLSALEHYRAHHSPELPNTGSLREDLLVALEGMGRLGAGFFAVAMAAAFGGLAHRSNLTPEQIRDRIFGVQRTERMMTLFKRADVRGEIDLARLDPSILTLPFDLVRHDLLMNAEPISIDRIHTIVDGIFMPLIGKLGRNTQDMP